MTREAEEGEAREAQEQEEEAMQQDRSLEGLLEGDEQQGRGVEAEGGEGKRGELRAGL